MKMVIAFVFGAVLAAQAWADANADAKAHSEAFQNAVKAGDVAAVMALYSDDAYVIWPGQGEEAHGKVAIEKLVKDLIKSSAGSTPMLKSQSVVDLGGGVIAVIGQWESVGTDAKGVTQTTVVRTSEVIKKVGNKTLYLVDHASIGVPAPAATP
jgi:ketosteroid isomerase-like protein